jgi:putative phosphonate metabolism protein
MIELANVIQNFMRYAVYLAPPAESPLGQFGNAWLGRDPAACGVLARPGLDGYSADEIARLTTSPARYGFHATLKPPFRLNDGASPQDMYDALQDLLAGFSTIRIEHWQVRALDAFIALVPTAPNPQLQALAAHLVEGLDSLRQPLTPDELARRRRAGLTPRQDALLMRWGYPYVMDAYRPHFTLTGTVPAPGRPALVSALHARMADLLGPHTITDVAVFAEPKGGGDFKLLKRFPLRA